MISKTINTYYQLTKPGILYGNALVASAGFLYASVGHLNWILFTATLGGLTGVMASACVFNNYFDRDIDAKMVRTSTRALVRGTISTQAALTFGSILGVAGALLLYVYTSLPAFLVAVFGWCVYVLVYTPLKHYSPQALWVGAIAGATPPVVGYAAVTGTLDTTALLFFIFLFVWQVPHFLGIALYRYDEYAAAGIPLLVTKPSDKSKKMGRIVFYASLVVLALWCVALMLHR